uniref:Retrovirus-related Pol polyprotein from transposon TNT 1-94 n=1 Tax=Cajanus cajan TaxID=3821 RepID=A0A151QLN3_CAJCA|nr:hypothetical protein KK1_048725 [Cajanus cajan]
MHTLGISPLDENCRHVIFDETQFPFAQLHTPQNHTYEFLDDGPSPYMVYHFSTQIRPQATPLPNSLEPISSDPATDWPNQQQSLPMPTRPSHSIPPPLLPISLLRPTPSSHPSPPKRHVTRSQHGIYKPKKSFTFLTSVSKSPLPRNPVSALCDPNWKKAMDDEYDALIYNKMWELVPRPPNVNVIRSM